MRGLVVVSCLAALGRGAGADPAASPGKRCVPVPVATAPARKIKAPRCHKPPAAVQKAVRADITKEYFVTKTGGRADVQFPCDGLGATIREITLETGGGHGGSLQLWHARRVGTNFDVHGLLYMRNGTVSLATGNVALPDLERARAGVAAKVREVAPPPKPGTLGGMSGSGSSHDFHVLIRLVDEDGRAIERRYTGYEGSSSQDAYLGLGIAREALAPITALEGKPGKPTDDDRAFFAQQFTVAVPYFDDDFAWWVMERFVDMAKHVGSPGVISGLLTRLTVTSSERSKVDARADAVAALANITGWDATEGGKKSVEQAAASYLAECRP